MILPDLWGDAGNAERAAWEAEQGFYEAMRLLGPGQSTTYELAIKWDWWTYERGATSEALEMLDVTLQQMEEQGFGGSEIHELAAAIRSQWVAAEYNS